ncbi:acetyl-CoA carboxylase biotin carboxyl carrier protein subunit [Candidatus Bathyarchaeota archaeon]|nr:acetyl-CoA carboxylase biotin carboxyl carrier protein subunit [Candidatus Bathyarchaeota archaeon]
MPTYEILIDGKPAKIELTRIGETSFTVKMGDHTHKVELNVNRIESAKESYVRIDGKTYKAELPKIELEKPFSVRIEEVTFKAELKNPARGRALAAFEPTLLTPAMKTTADRQAATEGAVTAPMTGKVVSVKAKKGEQVKANQILCIMEAMKMENEITAPKPGTVQEVKVSEGSSVSEGEILFIVN